VAASDWPGQSESLTGGSVDWSTVNFDRAETGLWRAGLGLDTGRPRHVAAPRGAMSRCGFKMGSSLCRRGSRWA
jgi:hypothetical protein